MIPFSATVGQQSLNRFYSSKDIMCLTCNKTEPKKYKKIMGIIKKTK